MYTAAYSQGLCKTELSSEGEGQKIQKERIFFPFVENLLGSGAYTVSILRMRN